MLRNRLQHGAASVVLATTGRRRWSPRRSQAGEGELTADGALAVTTGVYTGRSLKDKFIVRDALTATSVWWDNRRA